MVKFQSKQLQPNEVQRIYSQNIESKRFDVLESKLKYSKVHTKCVRSYNEKVETQKLLLRKFQAQLKMLHQQLKLKQEIGQMKLMLVTTTTPVEITTTTTISVEATTVETTKLKATQQ